MSSPNSDDEHPRLQKVLASAGVASRRASELLISAGRVTVNGAVVYQLGTRVDAENDTIHVDGERLILDASRAYWALHKPAGVHSTMSDPRPVRTLVEFLPDVSGRLFHVGRLDAESEGLLLLTNDGELAHRLTHPSFGVTKVYVCQVTGRVAPGVAKRLRTGVELDDGLAQADGFTIKEARGDSSMVEISLHSGRKHIVRRMLDAVGHPVQRLIRTRFGPVHLAGLAPGGVRALSRDEIGKLYKEAGL
jgi:pseudouridine synthase